jgi:hypothetical protein
MEVGDEADEEMEGVEETYLLLSSSPPAPLEEDGDDVAFRGRKATRSRGWRPRCAEVWIDRYSGGSAPRLPNAFFGPVGEFVPAWARFHSTRGFNPIPRQSMLTQTRSKSSINLRTEKGFIHLAAITGTEK